LPKLFCCPSRTNPFYGIKKEKEPEEPNISSKMRHWTFAGSTGLALAGTVESKRTQPRLFFLVLFSFERKEKEHPLPFI